MMSQAIRVFRRNKIWHVRFQHNGVREQISLKTTSKSEANDRAMLAIRKVQDQEWGSQKTRAASIKDIVDAYMAAPLRPSTHSKRSNVARLLDIILPGKTRSAQMAILDKTSTCECTYNKIDAYKTSQLDGAKNHALRKTRFHGARKAWSINSDIRKARSVFSRAAMEHYRAKKLTLPQCLVDFQRAMLLPEKGKPRFLGIDDDVMMKLDSGLSALKEENFELWKVISLARCLGLRNNEIFSATGAWIEKIDGVAYLVIRNREATEKHAAWFSKNEVNGTMQLTDELAQVLSKIPKEDFIVMNNPSHDTNRYDIIYRDASAWIKKYVPNRVKSLYEMRKQCGSEIMKRGTLEDAQKALRHKSKTTTENSYVYVKDSIKAVGGMTRLNNKTETTKGNK